MRWFPVSRVFQDLKPWKLVSSELESLKQKEDRILKYRVQIQGLAVSSRFEFGDVGHTNHAQ